MDAMLSYSAFVRAFEAGSFSAVAREMGTSQSAVSKQIAALEKSLGVQLFARTTRRLHPTVEALELYEHFRQLLDAIEGVKSVSGKQAEATGTLRITIPNSYGRHRICPTLPKFLGLHSQVRLEVVLNDQIFDLVEEGFELGIRLGQLASSTLRARPIGIANMLLVATSEYLEQRGTPESPTDLADHSCVLYGSGNRWSRWEFESENGRHVVQVGGRSRVNDPDTMYEMVRAHQGIALIPEWVIGDDIDKQRVRWLLQDYYPIPQAVHVVYPQTRFLSRRARCFIDFIVAELRENR